MRSCNGKAHPEPIDFVYASEAYGARLAAEIGARFVPVDPGRDAVPAAGRAIIADPFRHWDFLPAPVRPYFTKSVCVFGPESTGKTMLARQLAQRFGTIAVPEYGRTYTDAFGTDCPPEAFLAIAQGHLAATAAAARQARRILVLDTDPVLTAVWSDMLQGSRDPWFETAPVADLYLLTDIDVPWVDDGTRYFPGCGEAGGALCPRCRTELERQGVRYRDAVGRLGGAGGGGGASGAEWRFRGWRSSVRASTKTDAGLSAAAEQVGTEGSGYAATRPRRFSGPKLLPRAALNRTDYTFLTGDPSRLGSLSPQTSYAVYSCAHGCIGRDQADSQREERRAS